MLRKLGQDKNCKWLGKMLGYKSKAVFLDRDGVLNKVMYHDEKGIYSAMNDKELEFLPMVKEAIAILKKLGYLIIVISNQPGVAFGYIKSNDLQNINRKIFKALGVDAIYDCIHHPEFTGLCKCRKPKPGMFNNAIKKFNIDIKKSYVVGDNISDIKVNLAFKNRFLIGSKRNDLFNLLAKEKLHPIIVSNLFEAALTIKKEN